MSARDQMVGPWQVPVSDVGVTATGYDGYTAEAMAMGERSPVALLDAPASGRLAIGEAVTNIAAADIARLDQVRLSANWMAACGEPGEDADLFATVKAIGEELCPALGITIPVGKDSLSMKSGWESAQGPRSVVAPVSLIVSAFAPVRDVRRTLTPQAHARAAPVAHRPGKGRTLAILFAQVTELVVSPPISIHELWRVCSPRSPRSSRTISS
jgi:phosphoribosylformylglycinamidine synthase